MMKIRIAIVYFVILTFAVVSSRVKAQTFNSETISQVSKAISEGILMNKRKEQTQSKQTVYVSSSLSGIVQRSRGEGVRVVPGVSSFDDKNYSIKSEIRQWELNKQVELSSRYISRLPTNPWVGVAGDITMETIRASYGTYMDINLAAANVFRIYQGLPTLTTRPISWPIASATYSIASSVMGATITFAQTIDRIGTSVQIMNPPTYLQNNPEAGQFVKFAPEQNILGVPVSGRWEGAGLYRIPGGIVDYQETLITSGPGPITQIHTDWVSTDTGTFYRHVEIKTPATNRFERFVATHYPLDSHIDPTSSTGTKRTRTQQSYRISTVGGVSKVIPLPSSGIGTLNSWQTRSNWNHPIQAYNPTWKTGVAVGSYGITNRPPPNILFSIRNPLFTYTSPTFNVSAHSHYWTLKTPSYPSWRRQY